MVCVTLQAISDETFKLERFNLETRVCVWVCVTSMENTMDNVLKVCFRIMNK